VELKPVLSDLKGKSVVVLGAGTIGTPLATHLRAAGAMVTTSTRRKSNVNGTCFYLDLTDDPAHWRIPACDVVFICAAMTALADCRTYQHTARHINVSAAFQLVRSCSEVGSFPVFFSTNQVFPGDRGDYAPNDPIAPRSTYGLLKAEAEQAIRESFPACCIVRLSKVIAPNFKLFVDWREKLLAGHEVHAFSDMVMAPVSISTVKSALAFLAAKRRGGVWHVSGEHNISFFEAGRHLAHRIGASPALVIDSSSVSAGIPAAERPAYASLSNYEFIRASGIEIGNAYTEIDLGLGFELRQSRMQRAVAG
jgi:dTDP-4-dehydrorhamnose reductase